MPSTACRKTLLALAVGLLALPTWAQTGPRAEVIHWWTSGGESAAVKTLADAYRAQGGQWVDMAVALGEQARAVAINRIVGGNPPTAAQFNTSKQFLDIVDQGMLNNLDDVAARDGWDKFLPETVLNVIRVKGHYYAVPVNIHMPAWIWTSKAAFKKAGIATEPKTMDELWEDVCKAMEMLHFDRAELRLWKDVKEQGRKPNPHVNPGSENNQGAGSPPTRGRQEETLDSRQEENGYATYDGKERRAEKAALPGRNANIWKKTVEGGSAREWIWVRGFYRRRSDVQREDLLKIEFPLFAKNGGRELGLLILIKDVRRNPLDYYTFRRLENLRRSLTSALTRLTQSPPVH